MKWENIRTMKIYFCFLADFSECCLNNRIFLQIFLYFIVFKNWYTFFRKNIENIIKKYYVFLLITIFHNNVLITTILFTKNIRYKKLEQKHLIKISIISLIKRKGATIGKHFFMNVYFYIIMKYLNCFVTGCG